MHRKAIVYSAWLISLFGVPLLAAPDPDLFDGRAVPPTSEQKASAGDSQSGSGDPVEATSSGGANGVTPGEPRDLEAVGNSGGGSSVESNSSKSGSTASGNPGGNPVSSSAGTGSESNGDGEARSFEDFGFGGATSEETVDVNRSKQGSQSNNDSPGNSGNPPSTETPPSSDAGNESTGGSQPTIGNTNGDYGTNLPSGL